MKKLLSLCLSVIMLFTITAGLDFSSFAEDEGVIIPADHEHIYNEFITKTPTCTEDGIKYLWCTGCDREKTETIPATGHTQVIDDAVAATCSKTGLTQGSHCSVCGEVITAQQVVAKSAHTYDSGKITKKATCTANGTKTFICTVCEAVKEETIQATGHKYDRGTVTKKATCAANGTKTYTCTVCKAVKTETVKATGHKVVKDKAVKATYVKAGKTEGSHCSVCKKIIRKQKTVKKLVLAKPGSVKASAVSKGFKLSWKKAKDASGYQIQYSTSSKFKSAKTVTVSSKTKTKTVKKLKKSKKYYIRIRSYKTVKVNGKNKKVYSSWVTKSVKTKK